MTQKFIYLGLATLFITFSCLSVFAVGELIGLTVKVTIHGGTTYQGEVISESETTITLSVDHQPIVVDRDQIASITLIQLNATTTSDTPAPLSLKDDPAFAEVRKKALQKGALAEFVKDGNTVVQAALSYLIAHDQPEKNRYDLLTTKAIVGIGTWVTGLFLRPSAEENLYWHSQLPAWHGIVGLAGGVAGFGASVSLALGYLQKYASLDQLEPAETWFQRAELLYVVQGGAGLIHLLYDTTILTSPN
jgi:hypothetical protein